MNRLSMTSCPAALSLLYMLQAVPTSHGMPWPDISINFIKGRALPQDESSQAHTPSRLDIHRSIASSELSATRIKDGFSRIDHAHSVVMSFVLVQSQFSPGLVLLYSWFRGGFNFVVKYSLILGFIPVQPYFQPWVYLGSFVLVFSLFIPGFCPA